MPRTTAATDTVPILLVAAGSPAALTALVATLQSPDYELLTATAPRRALELARTRGPALILIDVSAPDGVGFDLARQLGGEGLSRGTPLLFVSARPDNASVQRAYALGAVDFLALPLDPLVLRAKVAAFAALFQDRRRERAHDSARAARAAAESGELQQGMAAALDRARDEAEGASRAKSMFLANISHEIRTPLNAILGFADLLLESKVKPADRDEFVGTIRRNGRLLGRLLDDILDLSRIVADRLATEPERCSLTAQLADVTDLLGQQAHEKQVSLRIRSDGAVPDSVRTDPTRLKQILTNIVGNAVKFTQAGAVEVLVAFDAAPAGGRGGKLRFAVTDTGRGISAEQRKELFQVFAQADASTTRLYGGSGLGLVLSRRLAAALGGDVQLTASELGKGSTFTVTVETEVAEDFLEIGRHLPPCPVPASRMRLDGTRVLVVEDAPDNRLLINRILRSLGASVELAHDGREGVRMALAHEFDVVLMDLQMPVCDGFEATAELRRRGYRKPIIALSAAAMKEARERSSLAGCNDHLCKPIDVTHLTRKVREYLDLFPGA